MTMKAAQNRVPNSDYSEYIETSDIHQIDYLYKYGKRQKPPECVIKMARELECPLCARFVRTSPARPANPYKMSREPGQTVATDFSYHTTPR